LCKPQLFESNNNIDIELVEYKENLAMTYIDEETISWKYESWRITTENNKTKGIQ
jgi:hypothetical protein